MLVRNKESPGTKLTSITGPGNGSYSHRRNFQGSKLKRIVRKKSEFFSFRFRRQQTRSFAATACSTDPCLYFTSQKSQMDEEKSLNSCHRDEKQDAKSDCDVTLLMYESLSSRIALGLVSHEMS